MTSDARRDATRLAAMLRSEHHARAEFLLALADFDRRRGWAALGHANLWAFLHHELGLSAGAAFQRKEAAALLQRVPAVAAPLRDGRLCLSSMAELARVLTPENQDDVLPRFFGKSAREAREEVAAIAPRPVVPARVVVTAVNTVPRMRTCLTSETGMTHPGGESRLDEGTASAGAAIETSRQLPTSTVSATANPNPTPVANPTSYPASNPHPEPTSRSSPTATRTAVEPLTADLRRLHITVSRRFLRKLDAARCARSHADASGSIEALLEEGLDLLLAREAKRLRAVAAKPLAVPREASADHVPARVRREVWARDEGRCQWPLERGGVCGSTWQLEIDHTLPKARGGPPTTANLRLLCHAHNAEAARLAYGAAWVARTRSQQGERGAQKGDGPPASAKGPSGVAPQA